MWLSRSGQTVVPLVQCTFLAGEGCYPIWCVRAVYVYITLIVFREGFFSKNHVSVCQVISNNQNNNLCLIIIPLQNYLSPEDQKKSIEDADQIKTALLVSTFLLIQPSLSKSKSTFAPILPKPPQWQQSAFYQQMFQRRRHSNNQPINSGNSISDVTLYYSYSILFYMIANQKPSSA